MFIFRSKKTCPRCLPPNQWSTGAIACPVQVLLSRDTLGLWVVSPFLKGGHLNKTAFVCKKAERNGYQASNSACFMRPNPICSDIEICVLAYCIKIFIQLSFKKKAYVLIEKNHSSCSTCMFGSTVQGLLFRASKFQPKRRKFAREHVTPPLWEILLQYCCVTSLFKEVNLLL